MAIIWKKLAFESDVITKAFMAAKGDIISASANDTPLILTVGTNGQFLSAASGEATGLLWAAPSAMATDVIWDAKGDLAVGTGANTAAKLTIGADDTIPMADAVEVTGIKWVASGTAAEVSAVVAAGAGTADTYARSDHVHAIAHAITDNHLVTIDGTPATTEIALWTANGLDGSTPAAVAATMALDDIGDPDAAVDFNLQQATDLVVMTVAAETNLPVTAIGVGQLCFCTAELSLHICTSITA